jgi:hypothetical protein
LSARHVPSAECDGPGLGVVPHHHSSRIASQALGRSCRNARAAFEHRLARRTGIRQHRGIDVNHDLVSLPRSARIHSAVEAGFGDQRQRVRCCCSIVGASGKPWTAPLA